MTAKGSLVCHTPQSSIISEWCYLTEKRILAVTWGESDYHYYEVPFSTVHAMMSADSLAGFLNSEVKPNYEARKMRV